MGNAEGKAQDSWLCTVTKWQGWNVALPFAKVLSYVEDLISVLWVVTTITSDSCNPPCKNDRKPRNGCELSGWHFNLWIKKQIEKKQQHLEQHENPLLKCCCLPQARMGRVFDGDPATLRQDNLPQCVCLLLFCFAIISPDIVCTVQIG